jgi:hypothetical protein
MEQNERGREKARDKIIWLQNKEKDVNKIR